MSIVDLTGQRFGKLVAVSRTRDRSLRKTRYQCICDCGATTIVDHSNLRIAKSCGCHRLQVLKTVNITHGLSHTQAWNSWKAMLERCCVETSKDFKKYGARGITVCVRWRESFETFLVDMGERPPQTSIERVNNNGNYEPGNCVWGTPIQQGNNKRNNRFIEYAGKRQTSAQWAREIGISQNRLLWRLKNWTLPRALTAPTARRG